MSTTVSEYIINTLNALKINHVFGVISIHNLPIADAIGQHPEMNFIPSRGEAGSTAMADSYGRIKGLGISLTSTGAGAGNAVGALLEALNAGTPMLHITGEIETPYLDKITGFIHETKDQQGFLNSSSKSAYRVNRAHEIENVLLRAIQDATTAPKGPVSISIPIDLQLAKFSPKKSPEELVSDIVLNEANITDEISTLSGAAQEIVDELCAVNNPVIWVGGGAKQCVDEIRALADLGIPVISSTHGRGILPDTHPRSLRAHHNHINILEYIENCPLMLVVGSKLRSNETASFTSKLGMKRLQIDLANDASKRTYPMHKHYVFDAKVLLSEVVKKVKAKNHTWIQKSTDEMLIQMTNKAHNDLQSSVGNYSKLCNFIESYLGADGLFVRDITISGSMWGSRLLKREKPNTNIHSLAGAIGLGLPHAIGVCVANPALRTVAVVGDGGIMLNIGELGTLVQENLNLCLIVMNDGGYGVMRGIQAKYFNDRQFYNELYTPDFTKIAQAYSIESSKIHNVEDLVELNKKLENRKGPYIIEVMMKSFGELKFAGPPQKKLFN